MNLSPHYLGYSRHDHYLTVVFPGHSSAVAHHVTGFYFNGDVPWHRHWLFAGNLTKFIHGSWIVLCMTLVLFAITLTWRQGRKMVDHATIQNLMPISLFLKGMENQSILRVKGTAVFMNPHSNGTPLALLHHDKHNNALHEMIILLTIADERVPRVQTEQKLEFDNLGHGFYRIIAHYGYSEIPYVPAILAVFAKKANLPLNPMDISYYLGRRSLVITTKPTIVPRWQNIL